MADDLAAVLTLLHDSGKRWSTLRAEGEEWSDGERSKEAFLRMRRPPGSVVSVGGTPGPVDRDPRWAVWLRQPDEARVDYGAPHAARMLMIRKGRRVCFSHPAGGFRVTERSDPEEALGPATDLVRPSQLLGAFDLEVLGPDTFLGRHVLTVSGRPRPVPHSRIPLVRVSGDEIRFAVDAERGVLLWLESRLEGEPFFRSSMTSVVFDEPLDDELFAVPDRDDTPPPVPPIPRRPPLERRPLGPPDAVLGAAVAGAVVVARTPTVVVAVDRIVAYPTGFELGVTVRTRDELVRGSFDEVHRRTWSGTAAFPGESLQVRMEGDLALVPMGGSGTQTRFDQRYWVAPLPPPGPVSVVVEWARRGLPETRTELDGAVIVEAAQRAEKLWP